MEIIKTNFGETLEGRKAEIFSLVNKSNNVVKITNYGATVVSIIIADKNQVLRDVVLGYDDVLSYQNGVGYFGAIIGRNSNRISNARFELNGKEYQLNANNGKNNVHSGLDGFDKKFWDYEIKEDSVVFSYFSKDGESGFPGNLKVTVTYTFTDDNELKIEYNAITDADTVVNLTNHSYFNLGGHDSGDILNHKLKINANGFTKINDECIPDGSIVQVEGTPFDFREFFTIGQRINDDDIQLKNGLGYDHNWVLCGEGLTTIAELLNEETGLCMEVISDMPGVQFYSGNFLNSTVIGKSGVVYHKNAGLCLETQYFPDSINQKNFISPILRANEKYNSVTIYKFGKI